MGPKAMGGMASVDNGFARFDHVRIPRDNMLSKFAQVTAEGKYLQPPHAKLSYGGMLYIRATISIRYATVRRQGTKTNGLETQTINYPSVHYRLLPILSHAYVFIQLGRNLTKAFDNMSSRLASGDTSLLAEMHATTSGLKILITSMSITDLEVARRSMGGHGYSGFAGLGRIYAEYLPAATYEGDNFVLDQQVVRAALKSLSRLMSAESPSADTLSPSSYYLRLLSKDPEPIPNLTAGAWKNSSTAVSLLEWRAALMVQDLARHAKGPDANANQRVSKAVTEAFVAAQVGLMSQELQLTEIDNRVIQDLYRLHLLTTIESSLADLLSFKIINPTSDSAGPIRSLRAEIASLCLDLLPNAIGLTDAFGFTDWELDSALGVHSGAVYESLWEKAQTEPLNREEVTSGYAPDMAKPQFSLESATVADIPVLAKIFTEAFANDRDTELKYLHEAPEAPYDMMSGALQHWMSRPSKYPVLKAVRSGEILGWMCWGYSGYDAEANIKAAEENQTEESEPRVRKNIRASAYYETSEKDDTPAIEQDEATTAADDTPEKIKCLKAIEDKENDYWDEILSHKCMFIVATAVSPSHQGQGVGSALIRWGTAQADLDEVSCWVHSSDSGWKAFEKNGFKEHRRLELELDEYADKPREGGDGKWGKYIFRYMQRKPHVGVS
ncbi:hypothetical protein HWV62_45767 [Athelia sp. TMB]|nr:hypothetical protein HWV62_45767 [Athelia sp. TMB]